MKWSTKVIFSYDKKEARRIFDKVYDEEARLLTGMSPDFSEVVFEAIYHTSGTGCRMIDIPLIVSGIACAVAGASLLVSTIPLFQYNTINFFIILILCLFVFFLPYWYKHVSIDYQIRRFGDLVYESMIELLVSKTVSVERMRILEYKWSRLSLFDE